MDRQRLLYLIKQYQHDKCSASDKAELHELLQNPDIEKEILLIWSQLHEERTFGISSYEREQLYAQILSDGHVDTAMRSRSKLRRLRKIGAIAAAFVLFLGICFVLFRQSNPSERTIAKTSKIQKEVLPGSKKAKIIFEDGTYQELGNEPRTAHVADQDFFTVDGQDGISYRPSSDIVGQKAELHTLVTPIGGEYTIRLSDGTKVWMNANSKLKYPISFAGVESREVELEGEAYFDVAKSEQHGKRIPFIVKSKGQILEVLGTEFNLNTFKDKITTTLIEGSVRLTYETESPKKIHVLKPNDQSIYDSQSKQVRVVQIDPYYMTAWKNGDFAFDNAPLAHVMDDIARWYDVDIEYKSDVSDIRFSGKVSKFADIETLLKTIEWTGSVKLKLNGRRITVTK